MRTAVFLVVFLLLFTVSAESEYVALNELLKETGARLEWDPLGETGRIKLGNEVVVFKMGVPFVLLGYEQIMNTAPIRSRAGGVYLPGDTAEKIIKYLSRLGLKDDVPNVAVIFIDPGHGGKDPGANYIFSTKDGEIDVREKDIVLDVSMRLKKLLQDSYPFKKILISRDTDSFLELEERSEMANSIALRDNEAIVFISIHANAAFKKTTKGFEVWILPPEYQRELIDESELDNSSRDILPILNSMREIEYSTESILLAQEILTGLEERIGHLSPNRGLREEEWFVVRNSKMPAVLIELGFITNRDEALNMLEDVYLQKLAEGIYNGVNRFIDQFETSRGFTE